MTEIDARANKNALVPHLYKHGWIRVDGAGTPVNEHTGGKLPKKVAEIAAKTDPVGIEHGPGSKEHNDAVHGEVDKLMDAGDHNTASKVLDRHWYHVQPKTSYMSGPFPAARSAALPPPISEVREAFDRRYRSREVRRRFDRRYPRAVPDTKTQATAPVITEEG